MQVRVCASESIALGKHWSEQAVYAFVLFTDEKTVLLTCAGFAGNIKGGRYANKFRKSQIFKLFQFFAVCGFSIQDLNFLVGEVRSEKNFFFKESAFFKFFDIF
jgi:hypothetical protein